MTAKTSSPVGRWRVFRTAALALFAGVVLVGRPAPANAAGPTFDLTTVADKTYDFRFRAERPEAVFAAFGSFHVDASGTIDSCKAWFSAQPGALSGFAYQTLTCTAPSTLNQFTLKDPEAGVYRSQITLQSSDAIVRVEFWMRLTDVRGRNGILNGVLAYQAEAGQAGGLILEGEVQSP